MKEFKIVPIRNGTVMDHIQAGQALKILAALGHPVEGGRKVISVSLNLPSTRGGHKDVLKLEDLELSASEIEQVQALSKTGTINLIRNYEVADKVTW
ncbi:MAG: aspartate carbamoyltransferase regulatory subunit [Thermoplasmatota archaeon]